MGRVRNRILTLKEGGKDGAMIFRQFCRYGLTGLVIRLVRGQQPGRGTLFRLKLREPHGTTKASVVAAVGDEKGRHDAAKAFK
jgi:hypothetical protein